VFQNMKIFAVFGNPILHSRSPQLFNAVLGNEAYYTRIRPQSAADIVDIIKHLPLAGANITAPYKENILTFLDEISVDAKAIGAVNTIVNCSGRLIGHNTDHVGVTESLRNAGVNLSKSKCLVLGGGGAARAAVYGLLKNHAKVFVCNRTLSKAKTIASDFNSRVLDWSSFDSSCHFDAVVSTLLPEALPPFFNKLKFDYLLDASYKPSVVSKLAREMKVEIIEGKWWLIHQSIAAHDLFIGTKPKFDAFARAFDQSLDKESLQIAYLKLNEKSVDLSRRFDLLISAQNMNEHELKIVVDDEIRNTFGS